MVLKVVFSEDLRGSEKAKRTTLMDVVLRL